MFCLWPDPKDVVVTVSIHYNNDVTLSALQVVFGYEFEPKQRDKRTTTTNEAPMCEKLGACTLKP